MRFQIELLAQRLPELVVIDLQLSQLVLHLSDASVELHLLLLGPLENFSILFLPFRHLLLHLVHLSDEFSVLQLDCCKLIIQVSGPPLRLLVRLLNLCLFPRKAVNLLF